MMPSSRLRNSLFLTSIVIFFSSAAFAWHESGILRLKVLTIAMYQPGDSGNGIPGEAELWIKNEHMHYTLPIAGAFSPLYYNRRGHGLIITGMGIANAAASMMAVGLNPHLDLSKTYFLIAGIAGTPPAMTTLGAAAWSDAVVTGDLCHHIDAREIPADWAFSNFRLGCGEPWCEDGWTVGTEVYYLNPLLTEWAYRLSRGVPLADSEAVRAYRRNYPPDLPAARAPFVTRCGNISGSSFFHGAIASNWASWWVQQWTQGTSRYCMTEMEDSGTLTALKRLAEAGKVSFERVMVLRVASNFDQPHLGQSAQESIRNNKLGFGIPVAVENSYRVGNAVARHIIHHWSTWDRGIPALPPHPAAAAPALIEFPAVDAEPPR